VRGITRADLVAYQQARLRPQGALLVVAGDITMPQLRTLAERSFAAGPGTPGRRAGHARAAAARPHEILLVNRPGSVQANIVVGNLTTTPADPTRYAATVTNKLLGGGADARLFDILRERRRGGA
jgi:predicted Zn-dependent peptidase